MEIQYPYTEMKTFLATYYSNDELDTLFFDVYGEGVDTLGGDLPREKLAQEIVSFCKRREKLPLLLDAMKRTRGEQYARVFPQHPNPLGSLGLKPAEEEISQDAVDVISLPRVQEQGGFVIDEPPPDWTVEELTLKDVLTRKFGAAFSGALTAAALPADLPERREILLVSSRAGLAVEFDPGVSKINGRVTLQIAPERLPVASLMIEPLERNSTPPAFRGQSFEHVFLASLTTWLGMASLKSSSAATTGNTKRLRLTAEFEQRIEDVIVDGMPGQSLTANQTVIGIQGYARDYELTLAYISQATTNEAEIKGQVALLQALVDSFKIIRPTNLATQERQLQALGDRRFQKWVQLNAVQMMGAQFAILLSQWRELDWSKAESKERFTRDVRRLRKAVEVFAIEDEDLDGALEELDEMSKMGRGKLKTLLLSDDFSLT